MADEQQPQAHLIIKVLFWSFVLSFFGGGAILFANLFGHFLSEAAFAIIALVIMAELMLVLIAGVAMRAILGLRAIREAAKKTKISK